jgi:hypothetical protein
LIGRLAAFSGFEVAGDFAFANGDLPASRFARIDFISALSGFVF